MNGFQTLEHEVVAWQHQRAAAYNLSKNGHRLPGLKIERLTPGGAGSNLNRRRR